MRRFGYVFHGLKDKRENWVAYAYLPAVIVKRLIAAGIIVLLSRHTFGP